LRQERTGLSKTLVRQEPIGRRVDVVADELVRLRERIALDLRRKLRHRRLDKPPREVVQLHRQLDGRERHVHAVLARDRQRGRALDVILSAQVRTRPDGVLRRHPDIQARADLRAGLGEAVVILPVNVADEVELLMQHAKRLARDLKRCKDIVGHQAFLLASSFSRRLSQSRVDSLSLSGDEAETDIPGSNASTFGGGGGALLTGFCFALAFSAESCASMRPISFAANTGGKWKSLSATS